MLSCITNKRLLFHNRYAWIHHGSIPSPLKMNFTASWTTLDASRGVIFRDNIGNILKIGHFSLKTTSLVTVEALDKIKLYKRNQPLSTEPIELVTTKLVTNIIGTC